MTLSPSSASGRTLYKSLHHWSFVIRLCWLLQPFNSRHRGMSVFRTTVCSGFRNFCLVIHSKVGFLPPFVCVCFFARSQKRIQLRSPNVTHECSKMSPGNSYLSLGQKVKAQGHELQKHWRRGSLHSCDSVLAFSTIGLIRTLCATWLKFNNAANFHSKSSLSIVCSAFFTARRYMQARYTP